ncbi:MAG TPA: hypothetical protein PKE04_03860, partial [Clostridia bacterium]|nr:hypothetical protein [Clostridia bacterium]
MNPFDLKPLPVDEGIVDWQTLYPKPYQKATVDPYTKTRIILMNGTEFEAVWFSHQFQRHCADQDLRRELALLRRVEQQQQKRVACLKPPDETILEHTIGYEQLAVDLTAALAMDEKDPIVKQALNFALLEDFDHLYRYADLLEMELGIQAQNLVGGYTEIMPGRPTIAEHRFPFDDVRGYLGPSADITSKLNANIITAAEQQTMNYYMNVAPLYGSEMGRRLYQEIAMIEEQHVTQYGSLLDPNATWLENLLMREYMECYLYYSFLEDEKDRRIRDVWAAHFEMEVAHLHRAAELLRRYERREWSEVIPGGAFPKLLRFHDTRDYVRRVLAEQVLLTADRENYRGVQELPPSFDFFAYQGRVNKNVDRVASHAVVVGHQRAFGEDYRAESKPTPVPALADRAVDNTEIARNPA